jgi:hypothetical protein
MIQFTPRTISRSRILARDRRLSALHEAAHAVVAGHFGYWARPWLEATDAADHLWDKLVIGHCDLLVLNASALHKRIIAVAGAVGVHIARWPNDDLWDELDNIHSEMSPNDRRLAGFPIEPPDMEWVYESEDFFPAIIEADRLLRDELAASWRSLARQLMHDLDL